MIKGVVFDAYGTLFDVYSVFQKCEEEYPTHGASISQQWRQKQLEYSWLRTLMNRYADFWQITEDALRYTLETLNLPCDQKCIDSLMHAYYHLDAYSDVDEALEVFGAQKRIILSNGNLSMLNPLVANAKLSDRLDGVLSVDELKIFKPRPEVYALATTYLGLEKHEILFVSSNSWDVAGAKSFGFTVGWINRQNMPVEHLGVQPDYIVSNLLELAHASSK